jgi:hypothetical protein
MPVIANHNAILAVADDFERFVVWYPLYSRMVPRDATPFTKVNKARLRLGVTNSAYPVCGFV